MKSLGLNNSEVDYVATMVAKHDKKCNINL